MFEVIRERLRQKHRTMAYPDGPPPTLPDRYRGRPVVTAQVCADGCQACLETCPTEAIARTDTLQIDLGRCIFCGECEKACVQKKIAFSREYRLAVARFEDLIVTTESSPPRWTPDQEIKRLFGNSLKLRQVSAGGCNACEADTNVLGTIGWDLGRFGIEFVASPRHADGLLVTGPVTDNMYLGLMKTYQAIPSPKVVIAVGSCAISGGLCRNHEETRGGLKDILPIDLLVPGCPPNPLTIFDGLLGLIGRI